MPELFDIMFDVLAPILLTMGAGAIYGHYFHPDPKPLSGVIVYVLAPCLVFEGMANADISGGELVRIALLVFFGSGSMALVGFGLARMMRLDKRQESALMLSVVLFNGASYGFPLNEFSLGLDARQIAIVFFSATVIVANTLGIYLASRGSGISTRAAVLNIVRVPTIYAIVLGVILNFNGVEVLSESNGIATAGTIFPLALARAIHPMGEAAVPAMLVLLGIQLQRTPFSRKRLKAVFVASGAALIIAPALIALLTVPIGLRGLNQQVAITMFAMPTAVIAGVFATEFGGDSEFVTSAILVSTLGSVLTLSVLLLII